MIKNHKLALSIADASWGKFLTMLEYKAGWYGRTILKIGTFEPSSKMCHRCGYINNELKLEDRKWICPDCGFEHDRDDNASVNIICVAKCPDKEEEEDIKKVKSCKKVASAGSTHSGCRRTSDSKFIEASNHTIPVDQSTGVI